MYYKWFICAHLYFIINMSLWSLNKNINITFLAMTSIFLMTCWAIIHLLQQPVTHLRRQKLVKDNDPIHSKSTKWSLCLHVFLVQEAVSFRCMWPWSTKPVIRVNFFEIGIYTSSESWINNISIDVWFVMIGQYLADIQLSEGAKKSKYWENSF